MPVVIRGRIGVNCHPVAGSLHVGQSWPLLPTGPTGTVQGRLAATWYRESANPKKDPRLASSLGHLSPHHRARAPAPALAWWMS